MEEVPVHIGLHEEQTNYCALIIYLIRLGDVEKDLASTVEDYRLEVLPLSHVAHADPSLRLSGQRYQRSLHSKKENCFERIRG